MAYSKMFFKESVSEQEKRYLKSVGPAFFSMTRKRILYQPGVQLRGGAVGHGPPSLIKRGASSTLTKAFLNRGLL